MFCNICNSIVDERKRIDGYFLCMRGHKVEDKYTKEIQEGMVQRRIKEEAQARLELEKISHERKNLHKKKIEDLEKLENIDYSEYITFRVMNPYEGDDKKNFASQPIDKHDTIPFYKRMDQLENELFPDFIYCRGERNPEHSLTRNKTDSFGMMLIKPELVDYVNEVILSVYIGSGTVRKHYWLEPFSPPSNTYLDMKIKMEKDKKIIRENKRFETTI